MRAIGHYTCELNVNLLIRIAYGCTIKKKILYNLKYGFRKIFLILNIQKDKVVIEFVSKRLRTCNIKDYIAIIYCR